ncbi:ThuA domain-containing protein [bacterium]|nr:ThuA domain-containing protein [bacterium]
MTRRISISWTVGRFLLAAVILLAAIAISPPSSVAEENAKTKVLLFVGGTIHDHKAIGNVVEKNLNDFGQFEVTKIEDDLNCLVSPKLDPYDVIVFYYTIGKITPEQKKGLLDFVSSGKGYVGFHSAADSFRGDEEYRKFVGGHFVSHPAYRKFPVKIVDKENPLTRGLIDFDIIDEQYIIQQDDPDIRVLATAYQKEERLPLYGKDVPIVWTKSFGKGRLFYAGFGHDAKACRQDIFKTFLIRATLWAAGKPVPDYVCGFTPIFDGKTDSGWHVSRSTGHGTGGKWVIENGAIVGQQNPPRQGGIFITDKKYGDFELIIEAKPEWGVDSGIFLRSTETGKAYQVLVDYHGSGNVGGIYGEGIGGFYFPSKQYPAAWKKDDWNIFRVKISGQPPKITVWMNGVHMVDYEDDKVRIPEKGGIAVQVHGGGPEEGIKARAIYRNVQIKSL